MTAKTWLHAYIIVNVITTLSFITWIAATAGLPAAIVTLIGIALISYVMISYISGQWFPRK